MKVGISGIFRARVFDENRKLTKDVKTGNSITVRGAFELINRMVFAGSNNATMDFIGGPVNDFINVFTGQIVPIQEANFVALSREDRIQYYFANNQANPALGDNRQWEDDPDTNHRGNVDWGSTFADQDVGNDYPPMIGTGSGLPSPFTNEATATIVLRPGSQEYRGFYILHNFVSQFADRSVRAVLASAVLPQKLVINKNDFLHISWTLKISPTFL